MAAAPAESTCSHSGIFTCGAAHHGDHQRRAHETLALGRDMLRLGVRVFGVEGRSNRRTGRPPRLAFEHYEAPRRELAVIGHPRGNGQERIDLGRRRTGTAELDRFEGAPGGEEFQGVGHGAVSASVLRVARQSVADKPDRADKNRA
jgi:hypothetical protein